MRKFKILNITTPMSLDDIERYYLEGWELISVGLAEDATGLNIY